MQIQKGEFSMEKEILERFNNELKGVKTLQELNVLRVKYLGKKGIVKELMDKIKEVPKERRKDYGISVNRIKREIEVRIKDLEKSLREKELEKKLEKEKVDITLPGYPVEVGKKHIITQTLEEIEDIFLKMGFFIYEGPEIESDYYNFEALNIPKYHPARDMWDTLFLPGGLLLRTHTSPVQIRTMEKVIPPLRMISPGKCYRRDSFDATHSPMFHQVEGLMIDEKTSMTDLMGILDLFAKKIFGEKTRTKFYLSYFPFVEPGIEMAVSCIFCGGKGCPVCKYTGWIEILGAGMVHPKVLKNVGYDPEKWQGFAFGMGVERIAMLKYGIKDIRFFFENDKRFLKQF